MFQQAHFRSLNVIKKSYTNVGQTVKFTVGDADKNGIVTCSAKTRYGLDEYQITSDGTIVALFVV